MCESGRSVQIMERLQWPMHILLRRLLTIQWGLLCQEASATRPATTITDSHNSWVCLSSCQWILPEMRNEILEQ